MRIELLDDCVFPWDIDLSPLAASPAEDLDHWFCQWARDRMQSEALQGCGLFLIHAHGRFTTGAQRQDLQGVELLKHIRLTPWIGPASSWHAIVYSFEPLESILVRKPGNLILKSPGVTFLRLPSALSLRNALVAAHHEKTWAYAGLAEILADLAANDAAVPQGTRFRPYVAADYTPPDSAHQISNWWGIYEMFLAVCRVDHPEYTEPRLPEAVRDFMLRLDTKKARWLEGSSIPSEDAGLQPKAAPVDRRAELIEAANGKTIVYVDDEASNGWTAILRDLLQPEGTSTCNLITIDKSSLDLRTEDQGVSHEELTGRLRKLAKTVNEHDPDLLILDLRLLGRWEAFEDPIRASGMELAREVRQDNPYLPILLFTASNKAQTVLISHLADIDDYWMKPGLGEHRGFVSREENLMALVAKLATLLGPDYSWMGRVAAKLRVIDQRNDLNWWEQTIDWPGPCHIGVPDQLDIQEPKGGIRKEVVEYVSCIIYTARMIFRMQNAYSGPSGYAPPQSVSERLSAALFNQVGQIIERVHGFSESEEDPFKCTTSNGRVGGYFKDKFVFRRCDWWAFYLFEWRNTYSHPGTHADLQDVKSVVSDLIAWLTCERIVLTPIDAQHKLTIARHMVDAARGGGRVYPVMRLLPNETQETILVGRTRVPCFTPGGELAKVGHFRDQLAMRGYALLVEESLKLMNGS